MKNIQTIRFILKSAAAATLLIGVSLLVFSGAILEVLGMSNDSEHFAVYLGSALIGFAAANWLFSQSKDLALILPLIYGNLISLIIAAVVDALLLLEGKVSSMVWLILLLHAGFALAFGWCAKELRQIRN